MADLSQLSDEQLGVYRELLAQKAGPAPGSALPSGAPAGWTGPPKPPQILTPTESEQIPDLRRAQQQGAPPTLPGTPAAAKLAPFTQGSQELDRVAALANAPKTATLNKTPVWDERAKAVSDIGRGLISGGDPALQTAVMSKFPAAPVRFWPQMAKAAGTVAGGVAGAIGLPEAVPDNLPGTKQLAQDVGGVAGGVAGDFVGGKVLPKLTTAFNPVQDLKVALGNEIRAPKIPLDQLEKEEAMRHIATNAVPDLVDNQNHVPNQVPVVSTGIVSRAGERARDEAQTAYQQWINRADQAGITSNPWQAMKQAYLSAAPKILNQQEIGDDLAHLQPAFDRQMTPSELDQVREELGSATFYRKTTGQQFEDLRMQRDPAIDARMRAAVTGQLYPLLSPEDGGASVARLKRIQGHIIEISNAAEKAHSKAFGEPANTPVDLAIQAARGAMHTLPIFSRGSGQTAEAPLTGKTNALIDRAFRSLQGTPGDYPIPPETYPRWGPPSKIAGLLLPSQTGIGVSGVTAPDLAGQARTAANHMNAGPRQLNAPTGYAVGGSGIKVPDVMGAPMGMPTAPYGGGRLPRPLMLPPASGGPQLPPTPGQIFTAHPGMPPTTSPALARPGLPPPSFIEQPGFSPDISPPAGRYRGGDSNSAPNLIPVMRGGKVEYVPAHGLTPGERFDIAKQMQDYLKARAEANAAHQAFVQGAAPSGVSQADLDNPYSRLGDKK